MATLGYTTGIRFRTRGSAITGQSDGDALTTGEILDESGNDYTPTVFHTPNYKVAGPNAQPYIKVNGAAEAWGAIKLPTAFYTDGGAPDGTSGAAVYVVVRVDSATPGGLGHGGPWNSFGGEGSASADDGDHYPLADGSAIEMSFCSSAHRTIPLSGISQDLEEWHLLRMRSATDFWDVSIAGETVHADASSSFRFEAPPAADSTEIGDSGVNNIFKGDVAEVVFYDHIPSDADDLTVLEYFRDEYDLSIFGSPVISGVADSETQITLTITSDPNATDHAVYRSLTPGFTPGPSTLLDGSIGAAPGTYVDTSAVAGTEYWYIVTGTDGVTTLDSNETKVTTPGVDDAPDLRLLSLGATNLEVGVESDTTYLTVRYQRSLAQAMTSPTDAQDSSATRFVHDWTGLSTSTTYWLRAQALKAAGWTDWSTPFSAVPTAAPVLPATSFPWVAPKFGQTHTTGTVTFQWLALGGNVTSLEVSDAVTTSWSEIADAGDLGSATSYVWDVSGETDGFYKARITFSDLTQHEHPGFLVDAAGLHTFYPEMTQGLTDWGTFLDTSSAWAWGRFQDGQCQNHTGPSTSLQTVFGQIGGGFDLTALVPTTGIVAGTNGFVAGTLATFPGGNGASLVWEFFYSTEHAKAGVGFVSGTKAAGDQRFIAAYVLHNQLGHYRPFLGCGDWGQDPNGEFVLEIVDQSQATLLTFTETIGVATSHMNLNCSGACYSRRWQYHVSLSWSRPDPGGFPNRYDIVARLGAPYDVVIEETVDLDAPLGCGLAGFVSGHQLFSNNPGVDQGWRETYNLTVSVTDPAGCVPPQPEPIEEDEFPEFFPPPGEPCALFLQTYLSDRVTLDWAISTDPSLAPGFLLEPHGYGEQEVDFRECRASIAAVNISAIDQRQVAGDQDTGWLTERLSDPARAIANQVPNP
jgi:hypothetical protein